MQDVEEENNYPFQSVIRNDFCEDTFILIPDDRKIERATHGKRILGRESTVECLLGARLCT